MWKPEGLSRQACLDGHTTVLRGAELLDTVGHSLVLLALGNIKFDFIFPSEVEVESIKYKNLHRPEKKELVIDSFHELKCNNFTATFISCFFIP